MKTFQDISGVSCPRVVDTPVGFRNHGDHILSRICVSDIEATHCTVNGCEFFKSVLNFVLKL